jgi:acetoin utilization protein AcuB
MSAGRSIEDFMTRSPHAIGAEQSLFRAKEVMRENRIRHLPVLRAGQLVGIVTDREVRLVDVLEDVNPRLVTVADAMETDVYSVDPQTPLENVAGDMASGKQGAAVVMRGQEVVGIFTTVDACRALASVLSPLRQ